MWLVCFWTDYDKPVLHHKSLYSSMSRMTKDKIAWRGNPLHRCTTERIKVII